MQAYSIIPPPTCELEGRNVILAECPVLGHKGDLVNVGRTDEQMNEENAGLLVVVVDIFPKGGSPFHGLHCAKENVGKLWVGKNLVVKYSLRIFTVHFGDTMMGKMWSWI